MRRIDTCKYNEYIQYAKECTSNHVYPLSIVTGTQDGEIYIDGKGCVLFWHYCGFAYISGDVSTDVVEEVYQQFLVPDKERSFILITDSKFASGCYSDRDLLRCDKRLEYYHGGSPKNPPELDDRFFVERIAANNIGSIQGRIIPSFSWKSNEVFLQDGFGCIARCKEDGSFAAVAFSSAVSPEEVDIGVETAETYRHYGLASYLAYKMCDHKARQKTGMGSR